MIYTKIFNKEIKQAVKRYLNVKIFEERILEHPNKALDRTSFKNNGKFNFHIK